MRAGRPFILRARVVLPVSRPALDNGAVLISGNRIAAVGRPDELERPADTPVTDLGDAVLLPGLINAHCHLDYTDMAGMAPATRHFTDWIKSVTALKAAWSYTEFAQSWVKGAAMLVRNGVTTVADVEAVPELLPDVWQATPLRVFSFLEMTGVKSRRDPRAILADAVRLIDSLPQSRGGAGLSPHAPYSTTPELQRLSAETARRRGWRVTTHVAESEEEFQMFREAAGMMHAWLARNGRNMDDCGQGSPVQHLRRLGALGDHALAIHVNCLADGDAAALGATGTSVVHCPRSHRFFGHRPFPLEELRAAGVNLCLGTDSLASAPCRPGSGPELDMFAELRAFAANHPQLTPQSVLRMATVNAARALGLAGQAGELAVNTLADLIAIPFAGEAKSAVEAVLDHRGPVLASMIDGQWAIAPARHSV